MDLWRLNAIQLHKNASTVTFHGHTQHVHRMLPCSAFHECALMPIPPVVAVHCDRLGMHGCAGVSTLAFHEQFSWFPDAIPFPTLVLAPDM
eukprot:2065263-Amphidinium_carterae.3